MKVSTFLAIALIATIGYDIAYCTQIAVTIVMVIQFAIIIGFIIDRWHTKMTKEVITKEQFNDFSDLAADAIYRKNQEN